MSIASVGARQNARLLAAHDLGLIVAPSNEYRANCSKCQC